MKTNDFEFYKPEIDSYIEDEAQNGPKMAHEQIFTVEQTNRLTINEKTLANFGPMQEVGEEGDAVEDELKDGFKTSYTTKVFRKQADFTSDLFETDQVGEIERLSRGLPQAVKYSRELNVMSVIRNMSNAAFTNGSGKTLISVSQLSYDGSTSKANTFGDGLQRPVNYDNAIELHDQLIAFTSGSGNLMASGRPGRKKVLWGSQYLREELFQIAGVKDGGKSSKPGTAENDSNYFVSGDNFDVMILDFVCWEAAKQAGETTVAKTSVSNIWDTMWGIMDIELVKKYFKVYVREGYANGKYDEDVRKENQVTKKFAYDKFAYGFSAPIGFAGSLGDSSVLTI